MIPRHLIDKRGAWEHWHPDACLWAMENIPGIVADYVFLSFIWTWFFHSNTFISNRIYAGFTHKENPWQMLFLCWLPSLTLTYGTTLVFKKGGSLYWGYPFLFVIFTCYYLDSFERVSFSKRFRSFDWWFHLFRLFSIVFISTLLVIAEATNYVNGCP